MVGTFPIRPSTNVSLVRAPVNYDSAPSGRHNGALTLEVIGHLVVLTSRRCQLIGGEAGMRGVEADRLRERCEDGRTEAETD